VIPKRLTPVFRDRDELASAVDLGTAINAALRTSATLIVICSPRSARSRYVNEEILAFKRLGREDRIFCLIVDGEPNASDDPAQADTECFPPALRYQLGPDGDLGTVRAEPIAADARPGKDGKQNAKLKLIAGVLGVGFDALRQREQQRRNRQLFMITTAAFAGMMVTSGLAAAALMARATAKREQARAEAEAETARQTTNFMVDLFRISDPSEARGNTVTAREMLDKGAARIETELAAQPAIRATLLDTVGTVYMGLGLYDQAQPLLASAVESRRKLQAAEVLPQSLNNLGDLLQLRAKYDEAASAYEEARALLQKRPDDPRAQANLARNEYGLGIVLASQGRYPEAETQLRAALDLQRRLTNGADAAVSRTMKNLAMVLDRSGRLPEAIALAQGALDMQREVHGTLPHPDLAEQLNDLGILLQEKGDYTAAEVLMRQALDVKRRLFPPEHPEIAMGLNNLGFVLQDRGNLIGAEATYRSALEMQRHLLGDNHPDVANTLNNLAFVQDDKGDLKGALATARESLRVYRHLFPGDNPDVARIVNRIGYWLTQLRDYDEAGRYLRESLDMRRRLFGKDHPEVGSSLTHLAILQIATRDFRGALESATEAERISAAAFSPSHWRTAIARSAEGAALAGLGRYQEAEDILQRSYATLVDDMGALPTYRSLARGYLENLYRRWGRPADARRYGASAGTPIATLANQNNH
jgi:tetratricopeptide (TPR) repeat protein